jgi:hypothetical protein
VASGSEAPVRTAESIHQRGLRCVGRRYQSEQTPLRTSFVAGLDVLSHTKKGAFWRGLVELYPNMIDYLCNPNVNTVRPRASSQVARRLRAGCALVAVRDTSPFETRFGLLFAEASAHGSGRVRAHATYVCRQCVPDIARCSADFFKRTYLRKTTCRARRQMRRMLARSYTLLSDPSSEEPCAY